MKRNYSILTILSLTLLSGLGSCTKDFLTEIPHNSLISNLQTGKDAETALTGCYSQMANNSVWYYDWNYLIDGDIRSDNAYAGGSAPDIDAVDKFTSIPTDNQPVTEDYQELYTDINATNLVLDNVPNIQDPLLTDERREQIIGEAKFLRAYHYSHLVRNYGPLVIQLHTIDNDKDVYKSRSPEDSVYAQIEKDLLDAEAALPVSYPDNAQSHTRATKGAADAVLAKIYAQQGKYQQCLTYCNKVLPATFGGSGTAGYELVSNYDWLFDGNHNFNTESIFELVHTQNTITSGYAQNLILPPSITNGYWTKFAVPSHDLVRAFKKEKDDIRYKASIYWEYNGPGAKEVVPSPSPYGPKDTIPYIWKIGRHWPGGGGSGDHLILIRLADIILLKAEALNKLGQTAEAIPLVNAIRKRVQLDPITVTSAQDVGLAILNERRLELAFEGERWYDLLRYGGDYTISLMNSQQDGNGNNLNYKVNKNKFLFPIPQTEIDNNSNITQNPGY